MILSSQRFASNLSKDELKEKINALIETRLEDKTSTHVKHIFLLRHYNREICGFLHKNNFRIWNPQNLGGSFYPVIIGTVSDGDRKCEVELEAKLNNAAKFLTICFSAFLAYGIITGIIIQENNALNFLYPRIAIGLLLWLIFHTVPIVAFISETNSIKKILSTRLELEKI